MPDGAATDVLFSIVPRAPRSTVAATLKVTAPPTGILTVASISPAPEAGQVAPPLLLHVQVTAVNAAGSASLTVAPLTACGPLFVATMV